MALDLGELSGELGLDITPLETKLRMADATLDQFAATGESSAKKAGTAIADGIGAGADEVNRLLAELPKNAQGTISETSREFYALAPGMRAAVLEAKFVALNELSKIPDGAQQIGKNTATELGRGLDGAKTEADQAGKAAGNAFGDGLKAEAATAAKAAGAAAGLALSVGVIDNLSVDEGRRKLAGQLGLTVTDMAAAGRLAGQVYANNFGTDLDQVSEAVRVVIQNTNLDLGSVDIQPAVEKILNLANVFDQDLAMSAAAAGQMVRTGMAKDIAEALDIITVGLQGPANKADDLLETFNEYGTQFRKVGLDGATSLGLITQAMQAGARDSDVAADAIKEFSIRAIDGSELTAQGFKGLGLNARQMAADIAAGGPRAAAALDTTIDRLRNIKDPADRARIATELFGTQAEDLGDALFAMDPSQATRDLGKFAGAADKVSDVTGGGGAASIETYKRKLIEMGRSAIESTGPTAAVAGAVAAFGPAVVGVLGPISSLVLARAVQSGAAATAAGAETAASGATVRSWLVSAGAATAGAVRVAAAWVLSAGTAMATAVASTAIAVATTVAGWILMGGQAVAAGARVVGTWILMGASSLIGAAQVAAAWFIALGPIGWAIAAVVAVGLLIWRNWDNVKKWTGAAWDWVVDKVRKVPGYLVSFFQNFTLPGLIIKHWDSIKSGITRVTGGIIDYVRGIPGALIGAIGDLSGLLYDKGEAVATGLWEGIKSMAGWLKGKVWDWVKSVLPDVVEKALGISSPSKVMRDIAKWVPAGMAAGIDDGGYMVDAAVTRMAGKVIVRPPAVTSADVYDRRPPGPGAGGAGGGNTYHVHEAQSPTKTAQEIARIEALTGGA